MDKKLRVLDRFVIRARRVEAHSLTQDRTALKNLGQFSLTGDIGLDGTLRMRRALPNEELFESLAARVRPLLLKSESIHYRHVLDALDEHVAAADLPDESDAVIRQGLTALRTEWSRFDTDTANVLGFAVQSSSLDGSDVTPQVSDTQLAAAWLYGDVVHVDVKGTKSAGQLLPVKERFSAAVMYFALVADLTLSTLDAVKRLHDLGALDLADQALEADVVVGTEELVEEATAFFGPPDTPMPDLIAGGDVPEGFKQFTVVDLLRQNPANVVEMVLEDGDGQVVASYEAAVSDRHEADGRFVWTVLIDNVTELQVSFLVKDDLMDNLRLEHLKTLASTNKMLLADAVLQQHMAQSTAAKFILAGNPFFALGLPEISDDDARTLDISVDALLDVVLIEQVTKSALKMLKGAIARDERVNLRRVRLMWQGDIVRYTTGPLKATTAVGTLPGVIACAEETFEVAGADIPSPTFLVRSPDAFVTSTTPLPESDPPAEEVTFEVPEGQVFAAWAPEKRAMAADEDLADTTPWDLSHLDEDEHLFGP